MTASPILESAIKAAHAGLSVHYQRGKGAFEPGWNSGPPKTEAQLSRDFDEQYNIGFQTGARSRIDGRPVVVLDVDIRSNDPKHLVGLEPALIGLVGNIVPIVVTGSGGRHFYFVCSEDRLPTRQATVLRHRRRWSTASRRGHSSFWPLAMPARCRPASILKQASRTAG